MDESPGGAEAQVDAAKVHEQRRGTVLEEIAEEDQNSEKGKEQLGDSAKGKEPAIPQGITNEDAIGRILEELNLLIKDRSANFHDHK